MEINSIANTLQYNQISEASSSKDQSGFLAILQNAIDSLDKSTSPSSEKSTQSNTSTQAIQPNSFNATASALTSSTNTQANDPLRQAFQDFVGQTFFAELIKSYRSTQKPSAYLNGGQAEKIFQGQLDQIFSEQMSKRSADKIADPMFERFMARQKS